MQAMERGVIPQLGFCHPHGTPGRGSCPRHSGSDPVQSTELSLCFSKQNKDTWLAAFTGFRQYRGRAGPAGRQDKPLPVTTTSHMYAGSCTPTAQTDFQLLASAWLVLTTADIWGINSRLKASLCLPVTLPFKQQILNGSWFYP